MVANHTLLFCSFVVFNFVLCSICEDSYVRFTRVLIPLRRQIMLNRNYGNNKAKSNLHLSNLSLDS
ncbi:hypothetical protein GQX74_002632 [Glossina fuscipes]|nr:hypothetical protein GQX74_002632 [Glossina fuscipes]